MTTQPPEEVDAQTPDKRGVVANQLFTSLLRRGGGWFANQALQRTAASRRICSRRVSWPPSLSLGRSVFRRKRLMLLRLL